MLFPFRPGDAYGCAKHLGNPSLPLQHVTYPAPVGTYAIPAVAFHSWGATTVFRQVDDLDPHGGTIGNPKFLQRHGIWLTAGSHGQALTHPGLIAELRPKVQRIPNLKVEILQALAQIGPGHSFDTDIPPLIQRAIAALAVPAGALQAGPGEAYDVPACVAVAIGIGWAEELRYPKGNGFKGAGMHAGYLAQHL